MSVAAELNDALHPRLAGTTEGMTLQVLAQIRDSLAAQTRDVRALTEGVTDVRERVIRLEENNRRLNEGEVRVDKLEARVGVLLTDKDRRDGAVGMLATIKAWAPFLAMLFSAACAAWLYGRSLGIKPAPPVAPVRLEASGNPHNQHIEGTVGGRP